MHCAASVSFDLALEKSRRVNVDGTRNVVELAERCPGSSGSPTSRPPTWPASRAGLFREDQLDVGQRFRNSYEHSKFEAERMLRERAEGLPLQILRPSIIVGDSRTGRTSSFNVLYGPLKAFARGRIPAIPARRSAPVDIVPVDYVADRADELAHERPGRHLPPRRRTQRDHRRPPARAGRPPPAAQAADGPSAPALRARRPPVAAPQAPRPAQAGGLLPLLLDARALRRSRPRTGAARGALLPAPDRVRAASGLGARTLCHVIDRLVEQIEEPLLRALGADVRPRGDRRPAPLRRGRARLPPARARARSSRPSGAARRTTPPARAS